MKIVAIDPGTTQSAMVIMDAVTLRPLEMHKLPNDDLQMYIKCMRFEETDRAVIEMLQSYGQLIGRDVLETAVWIGRFYETLKRKLYYPPDYVYRMDSDGGHERVAVECRQCGVYMVIQSGLSEGDELYVVR